MLPVRLANLKIYEIIPVSFPSKWSNTSMSMILIHDYIKYIFLKTKLDYSKISLLLVQSISCSLEFSDV